MAEKLMGSLFYLSSRIIKTAERQKDKLMAALCTLVLGLTPVGSTYPFAWAFFLAKDGQDGISLAVLCFCCLINGLGVLGLVVALGLFAFKKLLQGFGEIHIIKLCAGVVAAAFLCIAQIDGGVYGLAKGIAALSLVPVFTFLYGLYLTPVKDSGVAAKQAGLASLMFSFALFFVSFFPWKAPVLILAILTGITAARDGGMLCGGFFGFCMGLSCGSGYGAVCAICGLCTGLLFPFGKELAVPLGCMAGLCTGLYFYGSDAVPYIILCFFIAGICFFYFGKKLHFLPDHTPQDKTEGTKVSGAPFAKAFSELAENALLASGNKEGAVRAADDYLSFSTLLQGLVLREEDEEKDSGLYTKTAVALGGAGLHAKSIRVKGGRRKRIEAEGISVDKLCLSSEQIKELLGGILGGKMKQPRFVIDQGLATLYIESAPLYRIECSRTSVCKKGERVSGDTVSFFSGNGYFYSLISDGMGSGREASESSRIAGMFLEKLLLAGADRYSTLSLLNGYLASRETEVFATVDLFEADLYTGKCVLMKAGAAPSILLRGNKYQILESKTAPTGIIRDISAKQISFSVNSGDVLVMMSDGVCGDGNGKETAAELLTLSDSLGSSETANALLAEAVKRTGRKDDMSICVIKVTVA